jgi:hypothetical protein
LPCEGCNQSVLFRKANLFISYFFVSNIVLPIQLG